MVAKEDHAFPRRLRFGAISLFSEREMATDSFFGADQINLGAVFGRLPVWANELADIDSLAPNPAKGIGAVWLQVLLPNMDPVATTCFHC
jgi:hypothetical protein